MVKQAARLLTSLDQFMTHTFEIHRPLEDPLRSLRCSALCVDTALEQDNRGLN